jgi:FdhE protein
MQNLDVSNNSIHQSIHMTAEDALSRHPALADLIRPFVDLFFHKAQCIAHLSAHARPGDLQGAHDRLLSGIPVFTTLPLESWKEPLEMALGWMLPAIGETFPAIGGDIEAITAAYRNGNLQLVCLAEEYLDGGFKNYESAAQSIGVSGDTLAFVMSTVLSAALGSFVPKIGADMEDVPWSKGNCPICGALPSVSFLAKPTGNAGEFLTDSGGQKFLHCGLCGHNWRINRHICPVCDNSDADLRVYLATPDHAGERVDICRKCGLYLPCVDLRERIATPHLDTAAVCMVHLDILAQKQGFKPLSNLPWNRIEG